MVVETRYVAGSGVLVGAADHWVLVTDPRDERVVEELWAALGASDLADRVLRIVDRAFPLGVPALTVVDLGSPGRDLQRGAGRIEGEGPDRVLSLDEHVPPSAPSRRFLGGVVPAVRVELRVSDAASRPLAPALPARAQSFAPPPAAGVLIDGIPDEILAARGPDGPPPPRPRPRRVADSASRDTSEPDPALMAVLDESALSPTAREAAHETGPVDDPSGSTGVEDGEGAEVPPAEPGTGSGDHDGSTVFRPEHLVAASSGETVQAVWCPRGHLTPPPEPLCRICRAQVAPQHPQRVPRPVLGGLRLPTDEVVPLDRGVVLGRRPQPVATSGEWPHLVTIGSEHTFVSRMHLHLALEGWQVVVRDLGSRGGTTLRVSGQEPVRLVADQPYVLAPGSVLDLADTYSVRFEVGAGPADDGSPSPGGTP